MANKKKNTGNNRRPVSATKPGPQTRSDKGDDNAFAPVASDRSDAEQVSGSAKSKSSAVSESKPSKRDDAPAPRGKTFVLRDPWRRSSVAIILLIAWIGSALTNVAIYENGNLGSYGNALIAILSPNVVVMLPIVVIAELPIRLLRRERRMGIVESLATGSILVVVLSFAGGFIANLNSPQVVSSTTSTSASPTASPKSSAKSSPTASGKASASASAATTATPKATATAKPTSTAEPTARATGSAGASTATPKATASVLPSAKVAKPVSGTAPVTIPVTTRDTEIGLGVGDVVASLLGILVYPPAFRLLISPNPDAARTRDREYQRRQAAKHASTKAKAKPAAKGTTKKGR